MTPSYTLLHTKVTSTFHRSTLYVSRLFSFISHSSPLFFFFFFNDTATPEIYPLPLHDALPIWESAPAKVPVYGNFAFDPKGSVQGTGGSSSVANSWDQLRHAGATARAMLVQAAAAQWKVPARSEEHTSELQSRSDIVCRLLLEK